MHICCDLPEFEMKDSVLLKGVNVLYFIRFYISINTKDSFDFSMRYTGSVEQIAQPINTRR